MVLTVHHLSVSQSERIPWLLEELSLPYTLQVYKRNKHDSMAPPAIKNLPNNPSQSAPVFHDSDGDITLSESGAIVQYILTRYGNGRLVPDVNENPKGFARYCDWLHRANASAMASLMSGLVLKAAGLGEENPIRVRIGQRFKSQMDYAEETLGKGKWLAGEEFTAADIMAHFAFTNMRFFAPYSLKGYPNILRWTADCAKRPAFQEAFRKGDPEIAGLMPLGEDPPTEEQKAWKL